MKSRMPLDSASEKKKMLERSIRSDLGRQARSECEALPTFYNESHNVICWKKLIFAETVAKGLTVDFCVLLKSVLTFQVCLRLQFYLQIKTMTSLLPV